MSGWERRKDDPAARWNKPGSSPGKKDRRRWCRGKEGVEHQTAIVVDSYMDVVCRSYRTGRWVRYETHKEWEYVGERWMCVHIEQCQNCGKKLRRLSTSECPTRPGDVDVSTSERP